MRPGNDTLGIPCSIVRGGTSRAVFFNSEDLQYEKPVVERLLMSTFGSPDSHQINGLGGATPHTSKAGIVGVSSHPDADVDYTYAQERIEEPGVDWVGNSGNILAAVGPYAVNMGLVEASGDQATVRIHNTNTGKITIATVPLAGDRAATVGEHRNDGVPGTGPRVVMAFEDPSNSYGRGMLPTGQPRDVVSLSDGREVTVSVVDAGNVVVFLEASALGLRGTELPEELKQNSDVLSTMEEVRSIIAAQIGVVADPADATELSPGRPKVAVVGPPADYTTSDGRQVSADDTELIARVMTMPFIPHSAYMTTGAIATAAAALTSGTIVQEIARQGHADGDRRIIRVGHPSGVIEAETVLAGASSDGLPVINSVGVARTARVILDGTVYVPRALLDDPVAAAPSSLAGRPG